MNPKFHRYAIGLAISSLVLIAMGAYIASQASGPQPSSRGILNAVIHKDAAIVVGILAFGLAVWQWLEDQLSLVVWTAVALFTIEASIAWLGAPVLHATLAAVAFAIFVAIAVITSPWWNEKAEIVEDQAAPKLQLFATCTPALVVLQIILGAAYRHKQMGVIPHICGALVVTIAIVAAAMLVFQRHPEHRKLCTAAGWLIGAVLVQVMLGFTALVIPMLKLSPMGGIAASSAHVVGGSLTLAANLVLTLHCRRYLRYGTVAEQNHRI